MSELGRAWGGAAKVYTRNRKAYDELTDAKNPAKLPRFVDTFHVAAAIGLRLDRMEQPTEISRDELINVYTIDPDGVLWLLMSARDPEASGQERFEKLTAYAEYGVQKLAEEFRTYGSVQSALDRLLS